MTQHSPSLHTTGLQLLVKYPGTRNDQTEAPTICLRPAPPEIDPILRQRRYPQEREVASRADFLAYMSDRCRDPRRDLVACFAFAGDVPAFEEDADERLFRRACRVDRKAEACFGYAVLMRERRSDDERARAYRGLACDLGHAGACGVGAITP